MTFCVLIKYYPSHHPLRRSAIIVFRDRSSRLQMIRENWARASAQLRPFRIGPGGRGGGGGGSS